MRILARIIVTVIAANLVSGCSLPASRTNLIASTRALGIQRLVVLPPKVDVYEVGTGGVKEKIDEWSLTATENLESAIVSQLGADGKLQVARFPKSNLPSSISVALADTDLLFDAVNRSLLLHSHGLQAHYFEDHAFELSLGRETAQLNFGEIDAFLLVRGSDEISSAGRRALQGATTVAALALGVVVIPQPGIATLSLALVDAADGSILWHSFHRSAGATDLRSAGSAASVVRDALVNFPIR